MIFRRTESGFASYHRFYRVDVVVFCEGGYAIDVSAVLSGGGNSNTLDVLFWSSCVGLLRFDKTFHFKSIGSKTTLLSIAELAARLKISSISVCLDSDYDRILRRISPTSRTIYTHGYSWESDVLYFCTLERLVHMVFGERGDTKPSPSALLRTAVVDFNRELDRWCAMEVALSSRQLPLIFDHKKPLKYIELNIFPPKIRVAQLRRRLGELGFKRGPKRVVLIDADQSWHIVFGKLAARFVYHAFLMLGEKCNIQLKLPYEVFMRLAITTTFQAIKAGELPELERHFVDQRICF